MTCLCGGSSSGGRPSPAQDARGAPLHKTRAARPCTRRARRGASDADGSPLARPSSLLGWGCLGIRLARTTFGCALLRIRCPAPRARLGAGTAKRRASSGRRGEGERRGARRSGGVVFRANASTDPIARTRAIAASERCVQSEGVSIDRERTFHCGAPRSQAIVAAPSPAPARPVLAPRERPAREGGCEVKHSQRSLLPGECRGEDNREATKAVPRASHSHPPSRAGRVLCRDEKRPEARAGQPRSGPVAKLAEGSVAAPTVAIASSLDCGKTSSRPKISTKLLCQDSRSRW